MLQKVMVSGSRSGGDRIGAFKDAAGGSQFHGLRVGLARGGLGQRLIDGKRVGTFAASQESFGTGEPGVYDRLAHALAS